MSLAQQQRLALYAQRVGQLAADSRATFDNFSTPGWTSLMHTENSPQSIKPQRTHQPSESNCSRLRPDSVSHSKVSVDQQHHLAFCSKENQRPSQTVLSRVTGKAQQCRRVSVHEQLYLQGVKQESRRAMERILDDQYRRQHITPFRPQVSQKSHQLAQARLSRLQQQHQENTQLQQAVRKDEEERLTGKGEEEAELRENRRWKAVQRLFKLLSGGGAVVSRESVGAAEQQLPLMCVRALSGLLQRVYGGSTFSWLQFVGELNNKKTVANKEALLTIVEKWAARHSE